jgi:hypothetical protein
MKRRAFLRGLGAAGGLAFAPALAPAAPVGRNRALDRLRDTKVDIVAHAILGGTGREKTGRTILDVALAKGRPARHSVREGALTLAAAGVDGRPDVLDLVSSLRISGETVLGIEHRVGLDFQAWSRDCYLVLPGACYAGNRFQSRRAATYPPLLTERADIGPHVPPIVPAIPHLNAADGPSSLEVDTTDLAAPAVGVLVPGSRLGIVLLTAPDGRTAVTVTESDDRTRSSINIGSRYSYGRSQHPTGTLAVRLHVFECADVPALYERLFALRKDLTGRTALVHVLPFSAAFARHEQRANARWVEKLGTLAVGARDTAYSTWQTGWCGGLMSTLPLLAAGGKPSRERAAATIAFALDGGQAPSGFFHGVSDGKTWYEDGFTAPLPTQPTVDGVRQPAPPVYKHARRWHLVRRSGEALTYLVKQLALLERHPELRGGARSERWAESARRAADALVKLWERYKQLGQFVDIESGELIVGGSTSAGLAPAGLALAAAQLKEPRYLQVAKAIGEHYYERFVRVGLTLGGPGDALQAPDSESAVALLDSFMTLYEATRDRIWIDRARAAAHLLASWVISYDAPAAGRSCSSSGVRATGAVFWSAASRLGSPGYVLSSGDALLRLYRATGDATLLELLRDTVHNLAQYLPDTSEPRPPDPDGVKCPRSDPGRWLEPHATVVPEDGVFDAIGLLSYTEVPGIYVRVDTGFVFVFDHVTARIKERLRERVVLAVANPTKVDATVRILFESAAGAGEPLRPGAVLDAQTAVVPAGGSVQVTVPPL